MGKKIYQITNTSGQLAMIERTLLRETKHHVWLEGEPSKFRKHSAGWKFITSRKEAVAELEHLLKLDAWSFENKLRKLEDEAKQWGIEL